MSPEINGSSGGGGSGGGNPPSVTKRKKNRERKPQSGQLNPSEFNMNIPATAAGSSCNFFPLLSSSNPNLCNHNLSIPDISQYYSFVNYSGAHEPMSLPVYTNYAGPNSFYLNSNSSSLNFMSTPKPVVSQPNGDTSEYLSLPVGNLEDQIDEMSKRRFSDPGVLNDSDSSTNSMENKLIQKLGQQMNALRESNRKLIREMTEMRIELNMLKQQQNSKHYDREYEPGMLADIIREVRDAARVREDALLARVKHMIEEKQFSMVQAVAIHDLRNAFPTPADENHPDMLLRSKFEDSIDDSDSAEPPLEEPESIASPQISLRFGDPKPSALTILPPPQIPCQCKTICHCVHPPQPLPVLPLAPTPSIQPVAPVPAPAQSVVCSGCGSPLPCGCVIPTENNAPGVGPLVQNFPIGQPSYTGPFGFSGSQSLAYSPLKSYPGSVHNPTAAGSQKQTFFVLPVSGLGTAAASLNGNHQSSWYWKYYPINNAFLTQPASPISFTQPATLTPPTHPVSHAPFTHYAPLAPPTTPILSGPLAQSISEVPLSQPIPPASLTLNTCQFPLPLNRYPPAEAQAGTQIVYENNNKITNSHPRILEPVILPEPACCVENKIATEKLRTKIARLETAKTDLLKKIEMIECKVKEQETKPIIVEVNKDHSAKPCASYEPKTTILNHSERPYSQITREPVRPYPVYAPETIVSGSHGPSSEILTERVRPGQGYVRDATIVTLEDLLSKSSRNSKVNYFQQQLLNSALVPYSPSSFREHPQTATVVTAPRKLLLTYPVFDKTIVQPSIPQIELSGSLPVAASKVYTQPAQTVIYKKPTVVSVVTPIRRPVTSLDCEQPNVLVDEASWGEPTSAIIRPPRVVTMVQERRPMSHFWTVLKTLAPPSSKPLYMASSC